MFVLAFIYLYYIFSYKKFPVKGNDCKTALQMIFNELQIYLKIFYLIKSLMLPYLLNLFILQSRLPKIST